MNTNLEPIYNSIEQPTHINVMANSSTSSFMKGISYLDSNFINFPDAKQKIKVI